MDTRKVTSFGMVGIGVTAYRRQSDFDCIDKIIRFSSTPCKIVIVRDFEGVAEAKNECLKSLQDCENIFLFDSDIFPKIYGWEKTYIESGLNHLCFTFSHFENGRQNGNRTLIKTENGISRYVTPCGCMLYIHRDCINAIGGFDTSFEGYAYEHVNFSQRVHNAGLTPHPFMDVANSLDLFHSMDYHGEVESSVSPEDRMKYIQHNRPIWEAKKLSKEFIPYK